MRSQLKFRPRKQGTTMHFIEPGEKISPEEKNTEAFLAFKGFIKKNIVLFLVVMISFLFLFRYLYVLTHHFKSEVTILFSGYEIPELDEHQSNTIPEFAQMKDGMSRVYVMLYSKEMFDHLINKFQLYKHYGLDEKDPSSYTRLRKILKSNINFFQGINKVLTIQVSDPVSGKMSADIANEIAAKANEMNKKYITEKIESRIELYTKLHGEIKTQTESDIQSLKPQIDELSEVLKGFRWNKREIEQFGFTLNEIGSKIEDDISQLVQISKVNLWSLNTMKDDVMSNVRVLEDALPGETEDNIPLWLLIPFSVITSVIITIFLFNIFYLNRHYLRLLTT